MMSKALTLDQLKRFPHHGLDDDCADLWTGGKPEGENGKVD